MTLDFWTAANLSALPAVVHGFTNRVGGVSSPPLETLNLGLHVGDTQEAVRENRARVAHSLGFDLSQMVCAEQVHKGEVATVSSVDSGRGAVHLSDALPGTDALVTNTPGVLLSLFFADCVPVFFADQNRQVVAVAHAGWRGLVANVLENTGTVLQEKFGCHLATVQVAIGPHIGPEWFEVGPEVAAYFPEALSLYAVSDKRHVDLSKAARKRLLDAGFMDDNIVVSGICTASHPTQYFSHRRDNGQTGRMGAFIGLFP